MGRAAGCSSKGSVEESWPSSPGGSAILEVDTKVGTVLTDTYHGSIRSEKNTVLPL